MSLQGGGSAIKRGPGGGEGEEEGVDNSQQNLEHTITNCIDLYSDLDIDFEYHCYHWDGEIIANSQIKITKRETLNIQIPNNSKQINQNDSQQNKGTFLYRPIASMVTAFENGEHDKPTNPKSNFAETKNRLLDNSDQQPFSITDQEDDQ